MRAHRVRFTKPACRSNEQRRKGVRIVEGEIRFKHNRSGWSQKSEAIQDGWQKQGGMCPKCNQRMKLGECQLSSKTWTAGQEPRVVHKRCPDNGLVG